MKRVTDFSESGTPSKPAKRTKASKACRTCRQQKTRCNPVDPAPETGFRCKRCDHFNIECSFERSPPRKPVTLSPEGPDVSSVPWAPSPEPNTAERKRQGTSSYSPSAAGFVPRASTGFANFPSSHSHAPPSHTPPPSGRTPPSPGRSTKVGSVSEECTSASYKLKVAIGSERFFEPPQHPLAPPSPPRGADRTDPRVPYEVLTTSAAWTPNCGRHIHGGDPWSCPMSFVRNLLSTNDRSKQCASEDLVSQGIISPEEAETLTTIWHRRYASWFLGAPAESDPHLERFPSSAFLQSAQWVLASRHLSSDASAPPGAPPNPRAPIATRLSNVLDRCIVRAMIGLDETLSALQALLILASWTGALPAHTTSDPSNARLQTQHLGIAYDGEFFIGAAVSIASRMHLELDVEKALKHRQDRSTCGPIPPLPGETLERARMMFRVSSLCAFLNIGKGRPCSTRVPLHHAEEIFGSPSDLAAQSNKGSDAQLVFHCNLLEISLRFADLTLSADAMNALGPAQWVVCLQELLSKLGDLQQALSTAIALRDPGEVQPFVVLTAQLHFFRLLMLCRAFKYVFRSFLKLKPSLPAAIIGGVIGHASPLYPVEPFRMPIIPRHSDSSSIPHLSPSDLPSEYHGDLGELISKVEDAAINWARAAKEANETLMVTSLSFRLRHPTPAVRSEHVLSPMAYAPDYMAYSLFSGPLYAIKTHLMALSVFKCETSRAEVTRSLLARMLLMLQEASPGVTMVMSPNGRTRAMTEDSERQTDGTGTPPNGYSAGATAIGNKPHLANSLHIPPAPSPPPMKSPSLIGRCADVLCGLLRLWDSRTQDFRNHDSSRSSITVQPPYTPLAYCIGVRDRPLSVSDQQTQQPTAKRSDVPDPQVNDWNSEEGLHTLASSLSSLREMGAQQASSPSASKVLTHPPAAPTNVQTGQPPPPVQFANAGPANLPSDTTIGSGIPHFTGDLGELFGTSFGFDSAAFWDNSFLHSLIDEMN